MRILHVIPSINPRGGGPIEGVRQLRTPLRERGAEVHVCCGDPPDAPYVRESELDVIALGPGKLNYGFNPAMLRWLRENAHKYDAVIVEGLWQFHSLAAWLALRGGSTPYYVFTHGMLDPWFKQRYPLKHLKKLAYWLLGERLVLRDARKVLFTCEEERRLARESFRPYQCQEAVTSYGTAQPPADDGRFRDAFHTAFPRTRATRNILFFGRIHEKKGCDLLIDAFARVAAGSPDLRLVVAGPGDAATMAALKAAAAARWIEDRVEWTGMLTGDLKWGAFYAADVFCLPSHQENFGVAVVEAMGCGVPVLISSRVNIWREIEADGAGMVADDTVDGTHASLVRWLDFDDPARARMREAAAASFARRYRSSQVADRLLAILREPDAELAGDAPPRTA